MSIRPIPAGSELRATQAIQTGPLVAKGPQSTKGLVTYDKATVAQVQEAQRGIDSKVIHSALATIDQLAYDLEGSVGKDFFTELKTLVQRAQPLELQKAESELKKLETTFSANFKDPSEELALNQDLTGCSPQLEKFTCYLRKLALARRLETYYALPQNTVSQQVQELVIDSTNYGKPVSYPLARVSGRLDTSQIFHQSENLFGISHGLSKKDKLVESESKRQSLFKDNMPRLVRSSFPIDEAGVLTSRDQGLMAATIIHLALMKNFEPEAYNLALQLGSSIAKQSSYKGSKPLMLLPIAAHHSEDYIASHLLPALSHQDIELSRCPIFLFVNGNDPDKIAQILSDIDSFKANDNSGLDINVIVAEPSQWGMGLKSIPLNVGIITQLINGNFAINDADIPIILFDSDVIKLANNHSLQERSSLINEGKAIYTGRFTNSSEMLLAANVNYLILNRLEELIFQSGLVKADVAEAGIAKDIEDPITNYGVMGGNGMYSMMLFTLFNGIKPYAVHEDVESSHVIISQTAKAFGVTSKSDGVAKGIFTDRTETDKVTCDGGSIIRTVDANLPIIQQFDSHSHNAKKAGFGLTPIDHSEPSLVNTERLRQELEFASIKILNNSLYFIQRYTGKEKTPDNESWRPEVNSIFTRKIQALETALNELLTGLPESIHFDSASTRPQIKLEVQFKSDNQVPDIAITMDGKTSIANLEAFKDNGGYSL